MQKFRNQKDPTREEIKTSWKEIWRKKSNFNPCTSQFETLKSEYCKNTKQKQYRIETIDKVLKKLENGKAPRTDCRPIWLNV